MQNVAMRKAGQSPEEGQQGLAEGQGGLEEEGAGRRKGLGALGSRRAVSWKQQRNPEEPGCVLLGPQKEAKWERMAGPQIVLSWEDGGRREGGPLPG